MGNPAPVCTIPSNMVASESKRQNTIPAMPNLKTTMLTRQRYVQPLGKDEPAPLWLRTREAPPQPSRPLCVVDPLSSSRLETQDVVVGTAQPSQCCVQGLWDLGSPAVGNVVRDAPVWPSQLSRSHSVYYPGESCKDQTTTHGHFAGVRASHRTDCPWCGLPCWGVPGGMGVAATRLAKVSRHSARDCG